MIRRNVSCSDAKRKKDGALFGRNIEPSCAYCAHGVDAQDKTKCLIGQIPEGFACRRFQYDPLKREPKGEPSLGKFTAEDFKL